MTNKERQIRDIEVLEAAFELYKTNKIENVTMEEVADKANIGVATVYRHFHTKLELAVRTSGYKWKQHFEKVFEGRTADALKDIDAIDRLEFSLNLYIDLYKNNKELISFNDDLNHYMHDNKNEEKLGEYQNVFIGITERFHDMYERAKIDGTMRTDITEKELSRVLFHTMMGACIHYIRGFSWGSKEDEDYSNELIRLKNILMDYASPR